MASTKNLNSYIIVYRVIGNSGTINLSNKKIQIESTSQQNAIESLRDTLKINDGSALRVDRIEQVNIKIEKEKKRKRSIFGWVAFGIVMLASFARFLKYL